MTGEVERGVSDPEVVASDNVAYLARERERSPNDNLPLGISSFVGREREVSEVRRLVEERRLLTVTGPGGCGKTRLALEAARALVDGFEDGAWFVALAPLSDPEILPQAVAAVLGVREASGRPLVDELSEYLRRKRMLLVFDNCEHLIDACASLVETLLSHSPHLRVLATSREALGVSGESIFAVPSLSLPDPRHLPTAEDLPHSEAAWLFIERARAVKQDFMLDEGNAVAVAQVCYRLDGIPLAIELAAARVKVLSVEEIPTRLDDSLGLLTSSGRAALPRQRTLRAAMDWSHELLPDAERVLFRRLSVFAGGFTLEAAEGVCRRDGLGSDDVFDTLARLADKSLVTVVEQHDGRSRYRLLETIRQYAREKLDESDETGHVRRRHAEYYLALAEEAEPQLKGTRQETWLARRPRCFGWWREACPTSRSRARYT